MELVRNNVPSRLADMKIKKTNPKQSLQDIYTE